MDPLGTIVAAFREGAALVDASLQALDPVAKDLEALHALTICHRDDPIDCPRINETIASIRHHLERAAVSGDNLLIENARTQGGTLLVFGLARQASGVVTTQAIPIEREAVVLMGATPDAPRVFDHVVAAANAVRDDSADPGRDPLASCVDRMARQVAAAGSRLSVVKARLELQSSFIKAVADSGMANLSDQLGSDLDQSGIRDLAMATKRLLSRRALDIGSGNRQVLQALFARHAATSEGV